mmetsp:Transcript_11239/g.45710  ORF Transcript_11239/g.45710 Transcript_11239/m.45710 type:complete len:248 (-) Transcript_11239:154-897(-)
MDRRGVLGLLELRGSQHEGVVEYVHDNLPFNLSAIHFHSVLADEIPSRREEVVHARLLADVNDLQHVLCPDASLVHERRYARYPVKRVRQRFVVRVCVRCELYQLLQKHLVARDALDGQDQEGCYVHPVVALVVLHLLQEGTEGAVGLLLHLDQVHGVVVVAAVLRVELQVWSQRQEDVPNELLAAPVLHSVLYVVHEHLVEGVDALDVREDPRGNLRVDDPVLLRVLERSDVAVHHQLQVRYVSLL